MKGIADTGFLVAFASRKDEDHAWAVGVATGITEPLLTCEAVLAEASYHLRNPATVIGMIEDGMLAPAFDCREHLPQLAALAKRYADQKPDFADLCLIRMSKGLRNFVCIHNDI